MRAEEYERMYSLENTYWWFQGRKEIVLQLLDRYTRLGKDHLSVLDVGCGTGLMLDALRRHARPVGVDFSDLAMKYCAQRGIERLVCARVEALPFGDGSFDLLLALDLLEHLDDDAALMREMWRLLRPGGYLLISVPAYEFLWSNHDEALHHRRRYSRATLRQLIRAMDFEVVRFTSAITVLFPPIVLFRLLQRLLKPQGAPQTHLIPLPPAINRFLIGLLRLEARWLRRLDLPFGVSLLALLKKPETCR
jgi:SAM-dependent methyltransferase